MADINDLNSSSNLTISDLLPVWSANNGDTRKVSLSNLAAFLATLTSSQDNKVTQYATPLTGSTVTINGGAGAVASNSVWLILTPVGLLAALTIALPDSTVAQDKQEVLINTTQGITALTVTSASTTVIGAPTTLAQNASTRFRYDGSQKIWYKV